MDHSNPTQPMKSTIMMTDRAQFTLILALSFPLVASFG